MKHPGTVKAKCTVERKYEKKKKLWENAICEARGGVGMEDLRIIASISWGCVGDGNGGISQSSSQSNGIYVQRRGLQPGNKCLSLPRSHFLTPPAPFPSVGLSPLYLQCLCQYLPLSPSLYLVLILSAFVVHCITFSLTSRLHHLLQICRT